MLCLALVVGIDAGSPRPPHPRAPRRPGLAAERSRICCQQDMEPAPPPLTAFALASAPAAAAAAVGEGWFVAVLAPFLLLANTVEAPPFAALLRRRLSLPRLVSPPRAPVLPHCFSASSPPVLLPHTPSSTCRSHGHCVAALRCLPSPPQRGARVRRGRGSAQPPGGLSHPLPRCPRRRCPHRRRLATCPHRRSSHRRCPRPRRPSPSPARPPSSSPLRAQSSRDSSRFLEISRLRRTPLQAGPLAVTAIASLGFAALSARVADDASQRPAPISAAEARAGALFSSSF